MVNGLRTALLIQSRNAKEMALIETQCFSEADAIFMLICGKGMGQAATYQMVQKCLPYDVWGLIHNDVHFESGALTALFSVAAKGSVCGIVGRHESGEYRFCHKGNHGAVSCLDGCSLFFRSDLVEVDPVVAPGFNGLAEDVCLYAHSKGIPVVVPKCEAWHRELRCGPGCDRSDWLKDYYSCLGLVSAKWKKHHGIDFFTT